MPTTEAADLWPNLIATAILAVTLVLFRSVLLRWISSKSFKAFDERRRWIVQARNLSILLFFLGLIVIWAAEIKTVAISLVAIAAALVIATREIILCLLGGLVKSGAKAFSVGDRIDVSGIKGDVIDHSFLTTTLLEIGPGRDIHQYTGRTVVLPNSLFLTMPIINETADSKYVLHVFTVPQKSDVDWKKEEQALLQAARQECASFLGEAQRHLGAMGKKQGLEPASAEPRVSLHFREPERLDLVVRIPAPSSRKGRIEQAILRRYLENRSV